MTLRSFVTIVALTLTMSAMIGYARAEDSSSTVVAAKKSDTPKTSKKAPAHRIGRGVVVIYSAPRDPVSFNRKGEATFHPGMAKIMAAVDLDKIVPAKVAVSSLGGEHFTIPVTAGE